MNEIGPIPIIDHPYNISVQVWLYCSCLQSPSYVHTSCSRREKKREILLVSDWTYISILVQGKGGRHSTHEGSHQSKLSLLPLYPHVRISFSSSCAIVDNLFPISCSFKWAPNHLTILFVFQWLKELTAEEKERLQRTNATVVQANGKSLMVIDERQFPGKEIIGGQNYFTNRLIIPSVRNYITRITERWLTIFNGYIADRDVGSGSIHLCCH